MVLVKEKEKMRKEQIEDLESEDKTQMNNKQKGDVWSSNPGPSSQIDTKRLTTTIFLLAPAR